MSVITEADKALDRTKHSVEDAVKNLSKIIVDQVWGHDDFSKEYKEELQRVFASLILVREKLGPPKLSRD